MRIIKQLIVLVVILCLSLPTLWIKAEESYSMAVKVSVADPAQVQEEAALVLEAWWLGQDEPTSLEQLADTLYSQSRSDLEQSYGEPQSSQTLTQDGVSYFQGMKKGWYYVRQKGRPNSLEVVPFVLHVDGQQTEIDAKTRTPRPALGHKHFRKISTSTAPLAGASFLVLEKRGDDWQIVQFNEQDYRVVSDDKGNFVVGPLPFGTYALKEIKAPKGYIKGQETIPFDISSDSDMSEVLKIKNKPKTPPGIDIPYTGNAVVLTVFTIGTLLFLLGYRLVTYQKDEDYHQQ